MKIVCVVIVVLIWLLAQISALVIALRFVIVI